MGTPLALSWRRCRKRQQPCWRVIPFLFEPRQPLLCRRPLARSLPERLRARPDSMYLLFGWYKHGGLTGVTSATSRVPQLVALLNALLAHAHPAGAWTTLALFSSAVAAPHTDRRNLRQSCNHVLPLALPATEQYMWVTNPLQPNLQPMTWLGEDGVARPGFRLPLVVGKPVCVDPHSLHAIPMPLRQDQQACHVLLVGFSVPWIERAAESDRLCLQSCGFRLEASRGGVQQGAHSGGAQPGVGSKGVSSGGVQPELSYSSSSSSGGLLNVSVKKQELIEVPEDLRTASDEAELHAGLLEACLVGEGLEQETVDTVCGIQGETEGSVIPASLEEDVQPDTFAEGSVTSRGAYARRLETRDFEPSDWERVKQYLEGLGLRHLIQAIDDLGVDNLEDFGFLYREDLMDAGASKEEAEAILGCTRAQFDGRSDAPPLARAGFHRPSRPIAPERPATAARLVKASDRANWVREGIPEAVDLPNRLGVQEEIRSLDTSEGSPKVQAEAQGKAHPGELSADPTGQTRPEGDAEGNSVLGGPLGVMGLMPGQVGAAGSHSAHDMPGQVGAAGSHSAHNMPGQVGAASSHSAHNMPGQVGAAGSHSAHNMPGQVGAAGSHSAHDMPGQVGAAGSHSAHNMPGQVGAAGSHSAHDMPGQVGAAGSHSAHNMPGQVGAAGSHAARNTPGQVGAAGPKVRSRDPGEEGINPRGKWSEADREGVQRASLDRTGTTLATSFPEPLRFSPQPAASSTEIPRTLGFRPEGVDCLPEPGTSLYSLPMAAFSCKVLREGQERSDLGDADIVVEDLLLCARLNAARLVGEHLDTVLVQLHELCDTQRGIVVEEAARGADCTLEAQELSRLVEFGGGPSAGAPGV